MKQQNLANGKYYSSFRELYDDQNEAKKAEIRDFYKKMGFSERTVYRRIDQLIKDTDDLDALYFAFGIARHPKTGYFFEEVIAENGIYGLS